jgi:hypothetical protein
MSPPPPVTEEARTIDAIAPALSTDPFGPWC